MTRLLGTLVSVVQSFGSVEVCGSGVEIHRSFGTQLLAVTQISVPYAMPVSVYEFKHGCGAMDAMSPPADV